MPRSVRYQMRRRGEAPPLDKLFTDFAKRRLGGNALDDSFDENAKQGSFPDIECLRGLLLIEVKSLTTNQEERVNAALDQKFPRDERPYFYGKRDVEPMLAGRPDAQEIRYHIANKLSRTIEGHIGKANKQFENYRRRFLRKNGLNVLVLTNSSLQEFDPDLVLWSVQKCMEPSANAKRSDTSHIDTVLYISEKHFYVLDSGQPALAVICFDSKPLRDAPWKGSVVDLIISRWSSYRLRTEVVHMPSAPPHRVIREVPERVTRSKMWELEYEDDPYMRDYSLSELKEAFYRNMLQGSLYFLKGNWPRPSFDQAAESRRESVHINTEINHRNIDLRDFAFSRESIEYKGNLLAGYPPEFRSLILSGSASSSP